MNRKEFIKGLAIFPATLLMPLSVLNSGKEEVREWGNERSGWQKRMDTVLNARYYVVGVIKPGFGLKEPYCKYVIYDSFLDELARHVQKTFHKNEYNAYRFLVALTFAPLYTPAKIMVHINSRSEYRNKIDEYIKAQEADGDNSRITYSKLERCTLGIDYCMKFRSLFTPKNFDPGSDYADALIAQQTLVLREVIMEYAFFPYLSDFLARNE